MRAEAAGLPAAVTGDRPRAPGDLAVALALSGVAAVVYALSFHPDWIFDPLRYAELMQRGPLRTLLGPQHTLGNLLPLGVFRALRGAGYGGHAMPVLAGFAVAGAAAAVGLTFLVARRLGGSLIASGSASAALAVTAAVWRSGGSGGVYGVALAGLTAAWLAAARFAERSDPRRATVLGVFAGVAVASHLANLALVGSALVLVAALAPREDRRRILVLFSAVAAATALLVFVVAAGVATGWSLAGMKDWFLHPGIGGPTDRSSLVGWGIGGLFPAVVDGGDGQLQVAVTVLILGAAGLVAVPALLRSGRDRVVAVALLIGAGLSFLLASWYQALRPDYWMLGLAPIAILAGSRNPGRGQPPRRFLGRSAVPVTGVAVVALLTAWNATQSVGPSLDTSHARGRAAERIEAAVPKDAHVLLSSFLAGRLADDGYDAEGGFPALRRAVEAGRSRPGLAALVEEASRRPVFISSGAFSLTEVQVRFLGASAADIWKQLRACCALRRVLRLDELPRPEVLYRLTEP